MSRTCLLDTDFKSLWLHVWATYLIVFFKKINKAQPCIPGERHAR